MKIQMRNPQTGGIGAVDVDRLQEAVRDGLEVAQDVDLFNPETESVGKLAGQQATQGIADGLLPVGSHGHKVATTGKLESAARGALQGVTFGFADEIAAAVESALSDKTYQQARDESRANFATASEANPISSMLGELVGGAASFLVPGVGAIGKVTGGIGNQLASGAKLGALYGAGKSTADSASGVVTDAAKDAAGGAAMSGVMRLLTGAGGFAVQKAKEAIGHAFDPAEQRLLSLGAKAKDLVDPRNSRVLQAQDVLKKHGVFDAEGGHLPTREVMAERIEALRQSAADDMVKLFEQHGEARVDLRQLEPTVNELWTTIQRARPSQQSGTFDEAVGLLERIQNTDGRLSELWKVKKDIGKYVNWDVQNKTMNSTTDAFKTLNRALGDVLENATDEIAGQAGNKSLAQLNQLYAAAANTQDMLAKQIAQDAASSGLLGQKFGDLAGGGVAAALGSVVGGPVGAAVGYGASTLGASALRSPQGRLWRAQVGEATKARADQAATAMGAIPRTIDGVKQWVGQNLAFIDAQVPQMSAMARRLAKEPPPAAEQTIRTAMPFLTTLMTPSPYASELNGKVSEPADKLTIRKQLEKMPGMTPSSLAVRLSALNKDGTIPPEVYAPQQSGDPLQDEVDAFAARLKSMGY